ncbi:MAG TPA: hypothetical protein VJ887_04005, partial [Actinomycetota bacterium]|nr:hypothetical protein [Actinomycetota bacterium]
MAREDTPLDQEVFDRVLKEQLDAGTDKRVAEGRARSAAVRAYKTAHPEEEAAPAAAPAAGGNGEAQAPAVAAATQAAAP